MSVINVNQRTKDPENHSSKNLKLSTIYIEGQVNGAFIIMGLCKDYFKLT